MVGGVNTATVVHREMQLFSISYLTRRRAGNYGPKTSWLAKRVMIVKTMKMDCPRRRSTHGHFLRDEGVVTLCRPGFLSTMILFTALPIAKMILEASQFIRSLRPSCPSVVFSLPRRIPLYPHPAFTICAQIVWQFRQPLQQLAGL